MVENILILKSLDSKPKDLCFSGTKRGPRELCPEERERAIGGTREERGRRGCRPVDKGVPPSHLADGVCGGEGINLSPSML